MAVPRLLDSSEIEAAVRSLPGWSLEAGRLHRDLRFKSFVEAFGFMTQVALIAEAANHHPDWSNVYNRVRIDLTTHEAGGITERDIELARKIDAIASHRE